MKSTAVMETTRTKIPTYRDHNSGYAQQTLKTLTDTHIHIHTTKNVFLNTIIDQQVWFSTQPNYQVQVQISVHKAIQPHTSDNRNLSATSVTSISLSRKMNESRKSLRVIKILNND